MIAFWDLAPAGFQCLFAAATKMPPLTNRIA
jgi:hypothetical protein